MRNKVSNAGLTSLAERCPLLSFFCISGLKYVTDVGVARLGSGCPQLTHLDLSGVVKLSDGNRRDFALTGIQVRALHAEDFTKISVDVHGEDRQAFYHNMS